MIQSTPVTATERTGADFAVRRLTARRTRRCRSRSRLPCRMSTSPCAVAMATPTRRRRAGRSPRSRRRMLGRRLVPLGARRRGRLRAPALVAGARASRPAARRPAQRFADAWERGDYAAMYALLTPAARARAPGSASRRPTATRRARATLVARRAPAAPSSRATARSSCPCGCARAIFGDAVRAASRCRSSERDDGAGVDWRAEPASSPGCAAGEQLRRETRDAAARGDPGARRHAARRGRGAALRARRRWPPRSPAALGPAPPERAAELERRGVPAGRAGRPHRPRARVRRRARRHAGRRRCARAPRVLAIASPRRGQRRAHDDRPATSSARPSRRSPAASAASPCCARATARCSRSPGIAYSAPQPPGSMFKIITLAGALEAGVAKPSSRFPVADRRRRSRASSSRTPTASRAAARCRRSFADSCNSVFAPLGARARAPTARRARPSGSASTRIPALAGAARSTIPAADEIGDDLAVGSTAIGQGQVLATPLRWRAWRRRSASAACGRAHAAQGRRRRTGRARRRAARGAHDRPLHAQRRDLGHRRGRRDPGRHGGRQDGHRRAARHHQRRPGAADPSAPPSRPTSPTRTPGSPPSRRPARRGSRSRSCSSARAPAARRPRRPRGGARGGAQARRLSAARRRGR